MADWGALLATPLTRVVVLRRSCILKRALSDLLKNEHIHNSDGTLQLALDPTQVRRAGCRM